MKATDTRALKVHVSSGQVWYVEGDTTATRSGETVDEFLESPAIRGAAHVQLMGSHANARMITLLYDLKQKGKLGSLEVVTPQICKTDRDRRKRPEEVLMQLRRCARPASLGGFHEVTEADYRSYALTATVNQGTADGVPVNPQALRLLKAHPAWRPLSFIKSIYEPAVAGLLSYIIDPRWYVDTANPNSRGKIELAMGLTPWLQASISGRRKRKRGRHHKRCGLVLKCWKNKKYGDEVEKTLSITGPIPVDDSDKPGVAPYDFTWRTWAAQLGLGMDDPPSSPNAVRADLRASQYFIAFLYHTWLGELYRDSCALPERCASLFRPADFFKWPAEVAAYELHQLGVELP